MAIFTNSRGNPGLRCDACGESIRVGHRVARVTIAVLADVYPEESGDGIVVSPPFTDEHYHPKCVAL
jgi:hypothetical protein